MAAHGGADGNAGAEQGQQRSGDAAAARADERQRRAPSDSEPPLLVVVGQRSSETGFVPDALFASRQVEVQTAVGHRVLLHRQHSKAHLVPGRDYNAGMLRNRGVSVGSIVFAIVLSLAARQAQPAYDVLIQNGHVMDGSGTP